MLKGGSMSQNKLNCKSKEYLEELKKEQEELEQLEEEY